MEKFIKNALNIHLINNNLLSTDQYGFIAGRSTTNQLLVTLHDWLSSLDKNLPVDVIYLDFKKAFDTVPHIRLLKKLASYGIKDNILKWITSFLDGRQQLVKINNSHSNSINVTSGVPQGSVLGPTLFIYFINDLSDIIGLNTNIKIFADDTKIYSTVRNENDSTNLQETINSLYKWSKTWLLEFNLNKCKVIHIGKNNNNFKYYISNVLP